MINPETTIKIHSKGSQKVINEIKVLHQKEQSMQKKEKKQ